MTFVCCIVDPKWIPFFPCLHCLEVFGIVFNIHRNIMRDSGECLACCVSCSHCFRFLWSIKINLMPSLLERLELKKKEKKKKRGCWIGYGQRSVQHAGQLPQGPPSKGHRPSSSLSTPFKYLSCLWDEMLCWISMFAKLSCALSLLWQEAVFCLKGCLNTYQMEGVTILVSQSFIYLHILFIFMCLFVM